MDIEAWLRGLELEQYAPAFRDNDIDGAVLRSLTAGDLREIGIPRSATAGDFSMRSRRDRPILRPFLPRQGARLPRSAGNLR